jgi:hypothetical protein
MLEKKLVFANEVLGIVQEMLKNVFNLHSDAEIEHSFGISVQQMEEAIRQIIDSLPDIVFEKANSVVLEEIKYIAARDYIFFQIQEKWNDPRYKKDLNNFIQIFSRDIMDKLDMRQQFQIKEEK